MNRTDDLTNEKNHPPQSLSISVIIPTYNEENSIASFIKFLQQSQPYEIIIADGGSSDGTVAHAREAGVKVIQTSRGRAIQMNHAASEASGEFLLFLHADTFPPEHYQTIIAETLQNPNIIAGAFRFKLNGTQTANSLVEFWVHLRCRLFHTPYGDQGLFIHRNIFQRTGGFPDWPVMEDLEFIRRLKRAGKICIVDEPAETSVRRWREAGFLTTFLRHQLMLAAYYCKVSPEKIAKLR